MYRTQNFRKLEVRANKLPRCNYLQKMIRSKLHVRNYNDTVFGLHLGNTNARLSVLQGKNFSLEAKCPSLVHVTANNEIITGHEAKIYRFQVLDNSISHP